MQDLQRNHNKIPLHTKVQLERGPTKYQLGQSNRQSQLGSQFSSLPTSAAGPPIAEAFLLSMFKQISMPSCRTAPLAYYKAPPAGPSVERSSSVPIQIVMRLQIDAGLHIRPCLEADHSRTDLAGVSPTKEYQPALLVSLNLVSCILRVCQNLCAFSWIFKRFLSVSIASSVADV